MDSCIEETEVETGEIPEVPIRLLLVVLLESERTNRNRLVVIDALPCWIRSHESD